MSDNTLILYIPQSVTSDYKGYSSLLELCNPYLNVNLAQSQIVLDFKKNIWFEANLLPVLYAYMVEGHKFGITSMYRNQNGDKFTDILIRNGFAKVCFNKEHRPRENETCVPFKTFKANDTYNFGKYIDAELPRYFPAMEDRLKKDISSYIQEIFGNAQIHGGSDKVFTCGQYYPKNNKMDFTIVDLGWTFYNNVANFFSSLKEETPVHSIEWAVQPEHSTKSGFSGGFGLSLLRDFIKFNAGKFQIVSGNEYWELFGGIEKTDKFSYNFPGTIVNIEIDQSDKKFYFYDRSQSQQEQLF